MTTKNLRSLTLLSLFTSASGLAATVVKIDYGSDSSKVSTEIVFKDVGETVTAFGGSDGRELKLTLSDLQAGVATFHAEIEDDGNPETTPRRSSIVTRLGQAAKIEERGADAKVIYWLELSPRASKNTRR